MRPSGTVSLDCGSQQTFACRVTGVVLWTVTGLSGINAIEISSMKAASNNSRIATTDPSDSVQESTIIISGFTTADDGGTVQCLDRVVFGPHGSGVATIHIESGGNHKECLKYYQCFLQHELPQGA